MELLPSYVYAICICFVVSLSLYFKLKAEHRFIRIFPPFLFLTLLVELYGNYLSTKGENNIYVYNLFSTFEICFYLFFISLVIVNKTVRKVIYVILPVYAIFALYNIYEIQGKNTFHTISFSVGSLITVFFGIYYFLQLFRLPKTEDLKTNPVFWLVSGILFFYCTGFPLYGLLNYWKEIAPLLLANFVEINFVINILTYSIFTAAFIWIRTRKYTL